MTRWIAAVVLLAAGAPASAEPTWVNLNGGFAYDSQSPRYLASIDAVFLTKRWTGDDGAVDSDWLVLCGREQRWRLIDPGTATWSGPFQLVGQDESYRRSLCDRGRAGELPPYAGSPPPTLLTGPPQAPQGD